MRVYFLSSIPAALYVGGVYFGRVSDFERFATLSLRDGMPVRVEAEGMRAVHFFLDEKLPFSPPQGVDVYRLDGGLALYVHGFCPTDTSLKLLTQKRENDLLATLTRQGEITLTVESPSGFFTATLPPSFEACELFFIGGCIIIKNAEELSVYSKTAELLLSERYLSFEHSDSELTITVPLSDRYKRVAECRYKIENGALLKTSYVLKQSEEALIDGLIAYAFFECARIGGELNDFLADGLSLDTASIRDFLGDFTHVIPTDEPTECLLVYKKAERLFDVRKYKVTLRENKIYDVSG